jgi:hypothetical protein
VPGNDIKQHLSRNYYVDSDTERAYIVKWSPSLLEPDPRELSAESIWTEGTSLTGRYIIAITVASGLFFRQFNDEGAAVRQFSEMVKAKCIYSRGMRLYSVKLHPSVRELSSDLEVSDESDDESDDESEEADVVG